MVIYSRCQVAALRLISAEAVSEFVLYANALMAKYKYANGRTPKVLFLQTTPAIYFSAYSNHHLYTQHHRCSS